MIERLPVVTLDEEKWEEEWEVLRGEMDRWGKVWPKELGFGDPMDSVMLTKEQIMGELFLLLLLICWVRLKYRIACYNGFV